MVYHVWLGRVSGDVDVFFVISGFLVTGQLFRAASRGRIEFRPLWGRVIKRWFPAAMTVLLVITVASIVVLPQTRWVPAKSIPWSDQAAAVVDHGFEPRAVRARTGGTGGTDGAPVRGL